MTDRLSWKRLKVRLMYPLLALPRLAKAVRRLIVVMLNDPVCVVGLPAYMNCMLLFLLSVRLMLRSTLKSVNGSKVTFTCTSSVVALAAGVATLSLQSSQLCDLALSIYESSTKPKPNPTPGLKMPRSFVWPSMSPTLGMKPGSDRLYVLR